MNTRRQLLQSVIDDLSDLTRQLIFADYVEEHGDTTLAEYVRLNVERQQLLATSIDVATYRQTLLARRAKRHLRQHPECWQWNNVLALQKLPPRRKSLWLDAPTVSDSVLKRLEDLLQQELPIGFRMWLQKVSNGQPKSIGKGTLYSAERIIEELEGNKTYQTIATTLCPGDWRPLRGIYEWTSSHQASSRVEFDPFAGNLGHTGNGDCPGSLRIGEFLQKYYCLVLSGELRGAIWCAGNVGAETLYLTTPPNNLASTGWKQPLPLDTVSCLHRISSEAAFFRTLWLAAT